MVASESVLYFQFDKEGNMYIYEPGSGFSGNCSLVKPGDEIFGAGVTTNNVKIESESQSKLLSLNDSGGITHCLDISHDKLR